MAAILIWLASFAAGLGLLAITAAFKKFTLNALICALISINFCMLVLREHERPLTSRVQLLDLLANNARYLGGNWLWMSLAVLAMHLPSLALNGASGYALGGLAAATLCLCFASLLQQAAARHPESTNDYLRIAGFMSIAQLVGSGVTVAGLIAHGLAQGSHYDWPSLNVIAFSTVAMAVICARAVLTLASGVAGFPSSTAASGTALTQTPHVAH